jgi:hypothetical protein
MESDVGEDAQCRAPILSEYDLVRKQRADRAQKTIPSFFKKQTETQPATQSTSKLELPEGSPFLAIQKVHDVTSVHLSPSTLP